MKSNYFESYGARIFHDYEIEKKKYKFLSPILSVIMVVWYCSCSYIFAVIFFGGLRPSKLHEFEFYISSKATFDLTIWLLWALFCLIAYFSNEKIKDFERRKVRWKKFMEDLARFEYWDFSEEDAFVIANQLTYFPDRERTLYNDITFRLDKKIRQELIEWGKECEVKKLEERERIIKFNNKFNRRQGSVPNVANLDTQGGGAGSNDNLTFNDLLASVRGLRGHSVVPRPWSDTQGGGAGSNDNLYEDLKEVKGCGALTARKIVNKINRSQVLTTREKEFLKKAGSGR